jgi:hypothetical protein
MFLIAASAFMTLRNKLLKPKLPYWTWWGDIWTFNPTNKNSKPMKALLSFFQEIGNRDSRTGKHTITTFEIASLGIGHGGQSLKFNVPMSS